MFDYFRLSSPLGRSYATDPNDVHKTKMALNGLGYYDEPDHGFTDYPDESLFSGIETFQGDRGLKKDGVMKPGGETERTLSDILTGQLKTARTDRSAQSSLSDAHMDQMRRVGQVMSTPAGTGRTGRSEMNTFTPGIARNLALGRAAASKGKVLQGPLGPLTNPLTGKPIRTSDFKTPVFARPAAPKPETRQSQNLEDMRHGAQGIQHEAAGTFPEFRLGETLGLRHPIGLNQKNAPTDVDRAKSAFSWAGLYPSAKAGQHDGRMDQDLMRAIGIFQSENDLKQDFRMEPDGETAQTLDASLQNQVADLVRFADVDGGDGGSPEDGENPSDPPEDGEAPPDGGEENPEVPPEDGEKPEDPPEEEDNPCAELKELMDDAWAAHDELQKEYLRLVDEQERLEIELDQVRSTDPREFISDDEYDETESDDPLGRIGAYWLRRKSLGTYDYHQKIAIGEVRKRERILILTEQLNEVKAAIIELGKEREQRRETAEEYSRRYKECEADRDKEKYQNGGMTLRLPQRSTRQRSS